MLDRWRTKRCSRSFLDTYNDIFEESIGELAFEHRFFEDKKVSKHEPDNFDAITHQVFSQAMDFLNHHYQVAWRNNKKSGSHDDFDKFVGNRPYLFYYHLWLQQVPNLHNLAITALPNAVMRDTGLSGDTANSNNNKNGKRNYNAYEKKGGKVAKLLTTTLSSFNYDARMDLLCKKGDQTKKRYPIF